VNARMLRIAWLVTCGVVGMAILLACARSFWQRHALTTSTGDTIADSWRGRLGLNIPPLKIFNFHWQLISEPSDARLDRMDQSSARPRHHGVVSPKSRSPLVISCKHTQQTTTTFFFALCSCGGLYLVSNGVRPYFDTARNELMRVNQSIILFIITIFLKVSSLAAITIDTVVVGNPGNSGDTNINVSGNPGRVNYVYSIGTYETTAGQYTAFLNAVATTDTYDLYNTAMATDPNIAGIARVGLPGNYTYSVIGSPNHPVTYVNWGDAARFANWMGNGQPTGAQNAATTENGSYTLNGAISDAALGAIKRNPGAKWVIPSDNEWYKAAQYQPLSGNSGFYWAFPVRSNSTPYSDQPPGATPHNTQVANFYKDDGVANGYDDGFAVTGSTDFSITQNYLTDVGAYASSPSPYGTFDQGGNVWEWDERSYQVADESYRVERGGSWTNVFFYMDTVHYSSDLPSMERPSVGFRLAFIPEPSTAALAIIAGAAAWLRTKRRAFERTTPKPDSFPRRELAPFLYRVIMPRSPS
jgi:sulfatase modifying factor 1